MPNMKKPAIKVIYRKLGKEQAHGLAYKEDRVIHIDSRLKGRELLTCLVHEIVHIQNPTWAEIKVEGHSKEMADILWEQFMDYLGLQQ